MLEADRFSSVAQVSEQWSTITSCAPRTVVIASMSPDHFGRLPSPGRMRMWRTTTSWVAMVEAAPDEGDAGLRRGLAGDGEEGLGDAQFLHAQVDHAADFEHDDARTGRRDGLGERARPARRQRGDAQDLAAATARRMRGPALGAGEGQGRCPGRDNRRLSGGSAGTGQRRRRRQKAAQRLQVRKNVLSSGSLRHVWLVPGASAECRRRLSMTPVSYTTAVDEIPPGDRRTAWTTIAPGAGSRDSAAIARRLVDCAAAGRGAAGVSRAPLPRRRWTQGYACQDARHRAVARPVVGLEGRAASPADWEATLGEERLVGPIFAGAVQAAGRRRGRTFRGDRRRLRRGRSRVRVPPARPMRRPDKTDYSARRGRRAGRRAARRRRDGRQPAAD